MKKLNLTRDDLKPGGRWSRIAWVFGLPLAAFLAFCFVPVENEITRRSAVEIAEPETVRPETSGFIREIFVREGQAVKAGDLLARLENREMEQQRAVAEQTVQEYDLRIQQALGLGKSDEMRVLESVRTGSAATLARLVSDVAHLELRARADGVVLPPNVEQRVGQLLRPPDDMLCQLGSLNPMHIRVPLSEREVRLVRPGNPVTLMADAFPRRKFHGTVAGEPMALDEANFPPAFSKNRGGDVMTFTDGAGHEKLLEHTYEVTVEVENPEGQLRYGMTARARIGTGKRPFGRIALEKLTDLVSLDYRFR